MCVIWNPLYGILKIQFEIRIQRSRKPSSTEVCENRRVSIISCPPYWIRHVEKCKSDVKFVISDPKTMKYKVLRKSLSIENIMSAILGPSFWIPKIQCQIHNQLSQKLLSREFRGNRVVSKIACPTYWISGILRRVWLCQIGETIFPCSSTIPITVDHSEDRVPILCWLEKKLWKKKFPIFWYFSPNLAPYWISYWTKLNFDHGFLKRIPKTIRKHGFRLEISVFQSWEWGLNISKKIVVLGR